MHDPPETCNTSGGYKAIELDAISTYATPNTSPPPPGFHGPGAFGPDTVDEELVLDRARRNGLSATAVVSKERRRVLLGNAPETPSTDVLVRHTVHFVIRVLRSWPRLLAATHHTAQLPPIIHNVQVVDGSLPKPLAHCYTLAKIWDGEVGGSGELVQRTVLDEVQRLFREFTSYDEANLLAAAQSLLILLIILFFGGADGQGSGVKLQAELVTQLWDVKERLAGTGLFLAEESNHTRPRWRSWAAVSAKRRTILAMHHFEWAWSLRTGYPVLTCFELAAVPAPVAGYLWRETNETRWESLYDDWLRVWKDGVYKIGEFFHIQAEGSLDPRSEKWLSEADEFGMMLMAESKDPVTPAA
ncbi:hypothetical protein PG993_005779 [Apiospora rasikravindrae]|uniref:Uncharacterized protein n=1 Tax=Apiospora rasikravindrae TaxID=990691 RepID=A0ABR1T9R5_9PEZI